MIPKWSKKDLKEMDALGYKVIPAESEEECLQIKQKLKLDKRCAQAGRIISASGKEVYFVCTKERNK